MKSLTYFGIFIIIYIWLMAILSGCATIPFHATTTPEVLMRYCCEVPEPDKESLRQVILDNQSCNPSEPIHITITEYYIPDNIARFVGFPYKGFTIKGYIIYKGQKKNLKAISSNPGIALFGVAGIAAGSYNLTKSTQDIQNAFAKQLWKFIARKEKI